MKLRPLAVALGVAGTWCALTAVPAAGASPPAVTVTPAGPYHDGQKINISVGPNRYFRPYGRVNVLECADPRGKKANLPKNENSCDGNTIQGNTILVKGNGSFSVRGYVLYSLPSTTLGELPDSRPVCNRRSMCVLYVGENQSDFSWPKMFPRPSGSSPRRRRRDRRAEEVRRLAAGHRSLRVPVHRVGRGARRCRGGRGVMGVVITPGAPFTDGQGVTVSVGPNAALRPEPQGQRARVRRPGRYGRQPAQGRQHL